MSKDKKGADADELALLNEAFPTVESNRVILPRMGMLSKDITEESGTGRNKKIKVIEASGTFFTEVVDGDEVKKEFIEGAEQDFIIVFHRKQLKYFDKGLEKFISSPIFDNDEQIVPLYLDKRVIAKGTKAELQAKYPAISQKGKPTSDLKEYKILYVVYEGVLYQMNISITSGWAFSKYAGSFKDNTSPATVITSIGSEEETNGSNTYSKMTFTKGRTINGEEIEFVKAHQATLRDMAQSSSDYFLREGAKLLEDAKADKELDDMVAGAAKKM